MCLLSIDPGLQGTGLAVWERSGPVPTNVFVIPPERRRGMEWWDRAEAMAGEVMNIVHDFDVTEIVCEFMEMHQSARAQMMWKAGDFQRTLFFIGTIHGMAIENQVRKFRYTPPSEWKGQLPKSVVEHRIRRIVGDKQCTKLGIETHAWDAVGIGLWHRGFMK